MGTAPPLIAGVLPVDVMIDDHLYRAGGGEIPLAGLLECPAVCRILQIWRVDDGWLVSVYHHNLPPSLETTKLWWLPESGDPTVLVDGQGVMVSRGTTQRPGVQIAWVADRRLHLGTYADAAVTGVVTTTAPEVAVDDQFGPRPLFPQAVVGDALVMAGTHTGGGLDFWDVWFPSRGDYTPAEYPHIALYGTTADGERLLAWYAPDDGSEAKEACLGELDPEGFDAVRSVCPAPFPDYARVYPSPDGRWWIVAHPDSVDLYDAEQVWFGAGPVRSLPALGVWIDATSFVVLDGPRSVVGNTDGRPDQSVPQAVGPLTPFGVVVDLRGGF